MDNEESFIMGVVVTLVIIGFLCLLHSTDPMIVSIKSNVLDDVCEALYTNSSKFVDTEFGTETELVCEEVENDLIKNNGFEIYKRK